MKEFLAFISPQTPPPTSSEGLPYWIFWLLICIIILMVFFVFLRDKNLRRRINLFLFGAKKKLIKLRFQMRLKREHRKKIEIFRELGQKAWQDIIEVHNSERVAVKLTRLDNEEKSLIKELITTEAKIIELNDVFKATEQDFKNKISKQEALTKPKQDQLQGLEEKQATLVFDIHSQKKELKTIDKNIKGIEKDIHHLRKDHKISEQEKKTKIQSQEEKKTNLSKDEEQITTQIETLKDGNKQMSKELKNLEEEIRALEMIISSIQEEKKVKKHEFRKEIKEWETARDNKQEKIRDIKKNREPQYESLGKLLNKSRIDDEEISIFYSRIDRCNKRIDNLETQIQELE